MIPFSLLSDISVILFFFFFYFNCCPSLQYKIPTFLLCLVLTHALSFQIVILPFGMPCDFSWEPDTMCQVKRTVVNRALLMLYWVWGEGKCSIVLWWGLSIFEAYASVLWTLQVFLSSFLLHWVIQDGRMGGVGHFSSPIRPSRSWSRVFSFT